MSDNIQIKDRLIRWQSVLRDQLTFLNNLILTFSIATLGFLVSTLQEPGFNPICCQKVFFTFGMISIIVSILFGLVTSINRLLDFRSTVKKIKYEIEGNLMDMKRLKNVMDFHSKATWNLLYAQLTIFGLAILSIMISFFIMYANKLF